MGTVMTYGTFDLLHEGHTNLFMKCRKYGDRLIVGVTTEEFNNARCDELGLPHKEKPYFSLERRMETVRKCPWVDEVIVEDHLGQKAEDIAKYGVDTLVFGDDMDDGRFDDLKALCNVVFVPRTPGISSTMLRYILETSED